MINTETSKLKLMVVTVGIITGIIGILSGSSQLLSGSILIEGNNIKALPLNFPNLDLYTKMNGYGVFTLLTGIPYFANGLLAITASITLIICCLTVVKISRSSGVLYFFLLNVVILCFGASMSIPILEGFPAAGIALLALFMKDKERDISSKRNLLALFNFFYWWNIFSWVLFFPVMFVMSFYREIPQPLFMFMGLSMPIATIGALITGLIYDKSISTNEA
ncbi:MAG: hypothetical protein RID18_13550 [Cytophagales bacterium]